MHDLKELDVVKVTRDIPGQKVSVGAMGTIIMIYTHPDLAYEVEFCDDIGQTIAQIALKPEEIAPAEL